MKGSRFTAFVAVAFFVSALTLFTLRSGIPTDTDAPADNSLVAQRQQLTPRRASRALITWPDPGEHCDGRRIYMHDLPAEFNTEVVRSCDAFEIWGNFCAHAINGGLGAKTHRRSKSWYKTDIYMMELLFHHRVLRYDCLTSDPDRADAFFLPYYAGLDSLRYLFGPDVNRSKEHGDAVAAWLDREAPRVWHRRGGADHFVVMGRPAWDFSRPLRRREGWGTSFLELPALVNVTALVPESRSFPWQEQAVPYLTSFHPPARANLETWTARVRRSRRVHLFSFAGGGGTGGTPNIRHSIRVECAVLPDGVCDFLDCDKSRCDHEPGALMRSMLRSDFCLQPPGDTPTRRATFDGIIAGCIPVFFEPQAAYSQYTWHLRETHDGRPLEPRDFSVMIPKDDVVLGGLRIGDVLGNISREEVRQMRENVIGLLPRVMYRHPRADASEMQVKDAFDVAVEGVLRRVRRVKETNSADFSRM
eukprot:TRINITY_DN23291_c0_g1_i1.p1 TRINITY_DN23291_c0_g1~~TRINITY_DN23291_c0_g1_i1.p1  ORF type:complete len:475 (-),score=-66.76 TRINITY_DN23291_c0_g1_i1:80-1504(-)